MRTLTVATLKGGTAKTTTLVQLAGILAHELDRRVLVIDLDPDGDATRYWGLGPDDRAAAVQAGEAGFHEVAATTPLDGLDIVPSHAGLATSLLRLVEDPSQVGWVEDGLAAIPAGRYDITLVDTGAGFGPDAVAAALATRDVLTTTLLEGGDQSSLAMFVGRLQKLGRRGVRLAGILPCRYDARRKAPTQVLRALRSAYGDLVLDPVPDRAEIGELATHARGEPLCLYHPRSDALPAYRTAIHQLLTKETH